MFHTHPNYLRRTLLILAVPASLLWGGPALAEEVRKPAAHLLAPSAESLYSRDSLVLEAALRLVTAESAAMKDQYVRYWPAEQLASVPPDSYPRVRISFQRKSVALHMRLERKGDVFVISGSEDGETYMETSRHVYPMPGKTYVGLTCGSYQQDEPVEVSVRKIRLNGKPFQGYSSIEIGRKDMPAHVKQEGEELTLSTLGYYLPKDPLERGPFVSVPVEGDFQIDAEFDQTFKQGHGWVALACRDRLEADSHCIGTLCNGCWVIELARTRPDSTFEYACAPGTAMAEVTYARDASGGQTSLIPTYWNSWEQLTASVWKLADRMEATLDLPASQPASMSASAAASQSAGAEELAKLDQARMLAITMNPSTILRASRQVDQILNRCPQCAEAHYTAALCGALLACQDLVGQYQEQGRFLAGPLAHLLLAQKLAPAARPEDKLSEAWVMLACGYPKAAAAVLETLEEPLRQKPEVRALKMFITRDYRSLTPQTVLQSSAIEQLAWMRATQECGRGDLLEDAPLRMAIKRGNSALLPVYSRPWPGPGNAETPVGLRMTLAKDALDLLNCAELSVEARLQAGQEIAQNLGIAGADTPSDLGREIFRSASGSSEESCVAAYAGLMDLYAEAMKLPVGVSVGRGGLEWHSLGVYGYACQQRGLAIAALWRRANLIGFGWGLTDRADAYAKSAAEAVAAIPGAPLYFGAMGQHCLGNREKAEALLKELKDTPFGRIATVRAEVYQHWGVYGHSQPLGASLGGGRGSWQWTYLAAANFWISGNADNAAGQMRAAQDVDDYAAGFPEAQMWEVKDVSVLAPFLDRMPYNLNLCVDMGRYAKDFKKPDLAEKYYRQAIAIAPANEIGYFNLFYLYRSQKKVQEAISVGLEARKKCPFTVGLSNLMGMTAQEMVKQGRVQEALPVAREASRSGSCSGVNALAMSLEAAQRYPEAAEVYRENAYHYPEGSQEYIAFMLRRQTPQKQIVAEIKSLVDNYSASRAKVTGWIVGPFFETSRPEVFQAVLEGPLSYLSQRERKSHQFRSALFNRDFEGSLRFAREMDTIEPYSPWELLWVYQLAGLAGDRAYQAEVLQRLKKVVPSQDKSQGEDRIPILVKFLEGQSSAEEVLKIEGDQSKLAANLYVCMGIRDEIGHDMVGARNNYRKAGKLRYDIRDCYLSRIWIKKLSTADAATSAPATASTPAEAADEDQDDDAE